ncbi:MAG TPA: dialkylrecorsinol condensing enzyme DarA [Bacteroidales bacterium]|nr:dialkylrecorsinol condensing enzyme DarA [Bacteroidales bacterium]
MTKILILYYSQSGQLSQIVKNFAKPFENSDNFSIHYANILPVKDYKFPWKGYNFFDAFPESVEHIPCELEPLDLGDENFDLIVFAYSVWYMSPSIPSNSFLLSDQAKRIFKGKPVITLLGVRNMWVVAQEYVKQKIDELGGKLIGNIVLRDRAENLTGIITISYFLFTGKKDRFLGFFPKPAISDEDIKGAEKYGEIVKKHIEHNNFDDLQHNLVKAKAVKINPYLATTENMAYNRVFTKWSKFMLKKGGPGNPARKTRVRIFACYFPFAILVIAPIEYIFFIIFAPFRLGKIKEQIRYYSSTENKANKQNLTQNAE